jgi:hypothetical protein
MAVLSRQVRNEEGEDLATITADRVGGADIVNFNMPEFGAMLTPGEAERLAEALPLAQRR